MNIHQLSVSHDERQDRLLWRLNTLDGQEFQFWLTRRMLVRLLPALNQAMLKLHANSPGLASTDKQSLQILRDFSRENLKAKADFKTPFATGAKDKPLGQSPLLVTDAQLSVDAQGAMTLVLEEKLGQQCKSCRLHLPGDLVEGLLMLTQKALQSADWGLPLFESGAPAAQVQDGHDGPGSHNAEQVYKH